MSHVARRPGDAFEAPRPRLPERQSWTDTRLPVSRRKNARPWALVRVVADGTCRIVATFRTYESVRAALAFRRSKGPCDLKVINTVKDPELTGAFVP